MYRKYLRITIAREQAANFISFMSQLEGVFLDEILKIENDILYINITSYKAVDDFIKAIKEQEQFESIKYNHLTIRYISERSFLYESI